MAYQTISDDLFHITRLILHSAVLTTSYADKKTKNVVSIVEDKKSLIIRQKVFIQKMKSKSCSIIVKCKDKMFVLYVDLLSRIIMNNK